jgi:DNA primase
MGIPLPRMQYSSESEAEDAGKRGRLIEMHERACKFFEEQLRRPEGAQAREYLAGRGLKEETIRTFRIGFAPDSGFTLKDRLKADFSEEMMRASGLFSFKEGSEGNAAAMYSKFRNRIMFPIANENGKIIAFTGRTLAKDEKSGPKYLNSPETPIYSKGRVLYNLDRAKEAIRKLGYVILVEGQMDCIAVYSAGFHNVAASSGTAFTETQVRLLGRFSKDIVVNFDPDTAGAAATDKSLGMLLEEEFNIRVLRLEAGFDPDLFIRKNGAEAYAKALKGSAKYFDYLVERALKLFPTRSPEGKKNAVNFLLPHIHRVPSRIVRDSLAADVAQKLGIDSAVLRQEFKAAAVSRGANVSTSQDAVLLDEEKRLVRLLFRTDQEISELGYDPQPKILKGLRESHFHVGLATETLLQKIMDQQDQIDDLLSLNLADPERQLLMRLITADLPRYAEHELDDVLLVLSTRRYRQELEFELPRLMEEANKRGDQARFMELASRKMELAQRMRPLSDMRR